MNPIVSLIIYLVFALLLVAGVFGEFYFLKRKGQVASEDKIKEAKQTALKILETVGLALFTNAEVTYGGGTGVLKMSAVIGQLVAMLPDDVKELVPTDWLAEKAEIFLEDAKKKWQNNERLLSNFKTKD